MTMPTPVKLASPIVCPKCRTPGSLSVHFRRVKVAGVPYPALVPKWIRCARSRFCGWWDVIRENPDGG